ncbi:zinc-finger domain-containing protein [Lederbergia graminis]|uniref:Zinc-finger domain-containing protein n=1 Tax=Lederbergia graminis TaxID=735518 RepID=A0ABW0LEE3_9BACI|nr:zinc-finger domain-containing protein [Paenibacillus bovis]HLU21386.1 zinc-finger domain-containing protein [Bacillaceae bacterium]
MKRTDIYREIDELITSYCNGCFLQSHFRKQYGKTYSHQFCIKQCTIGQSLQEKGNYLLSLKNK